MGVLNYTTAKVNELLDKIDKAPETIENGKTPVFVTGTTTTLDPGLSATAEVVQDGVDENGNPKYKINFGVPKGLDGASGGGGGVADSVQWTKVLNKPSWVDSPTKPTYTASEVGALPVGTTIPSKTSQLTNDSKFLTSADFKTINGESIVGSGNISLSGTGGITEAPKNGKTYGRNNGAWVETSQMGEAPSDNKAYARKNKGWIEVLESTEKSALTSYVKPESYSAIEATDSINTAIGKLEAGIGAHGGGTSNDVFYLHEAVYLLKAGATADEIKSAFGGDEGIEAMKEAMKAQKEIRLVFSGSSDAYAYNINVSYDSVFNAGLWGISFECNIWSTNSYLKYIKSGSVKIIYPQGYTIKQELYSLTGESTSDEISIAVGGEAGLKGIIQAIKDGNRFFINGTLTDVPLKTPVSPNIYKEVDNGDLSVGFAGLGYMLWGGVGGILIINYTKASNTFSAQVIPIGG